MNDLLKNPAMIAGIVVILVVVAVAGKAGGPQYAVTATDPAAFKARADAQAVTDGTLTSARGDIMTAVLGYSKQRDDYRATTLKLRNEFNLGQSQLASTERVTMAGMQSAERLGMADVGLQRDSLASQERITTMQENTKQSGQIFDFFGNIIGGIFKLFTGGLI